MKFRSKKDKNNKRVAYPINQSNNKKRQPKRYVPPSFGSKLNVKGDIKNINRKDPDSDHDREVSLYKRKLNHQVDRQHLKEKKRINKQEEKQLKKERKLQEKQDQQEINNQPQDNVNIENRGDYQ